MENLTSWELYLLMGKNYAAYMNEEITAKEFDKCLLCDTNREQRRRQSEVKELRKRLKENLPESEKIDIINKLEKVRLEALDFLKKESESYLQETD